MKYSFSISLKKTALSFLTTKRNSFNPCAYQSTSQMKAFVHRQLQTKSLVYIPAQWQQICKCPNWSLSDTKRALPCCKKGTGEVALQRDKSYVSISKSLTFFYDNKVVTQNNLASFVCGIVEMITNIGKRRIGPHEMHL